MLMVNPAATITMQSMANNVAPMDMNSALWWTSRAIMSVPPVVAPPLKIMPRPMPMESPPNTAASRGSSVTTGTGT